jgi:PHD finger protein 20
MDASIAGSEHLTSEELVNCTCRRIEEDGLMIQCDICLCWQHGYCAGIEDEDPVPEKHVCETCRQPVGGRTEAKFSLDQDWLKEGKLPSTDAILDHQITKRKSSSAIFDR